MAFPYISIALLQLEYIVQLYSVSGMVFKTECV